MAIELASTYVSVGLSTQGLHKQIQKAFGDAGKPAGRSLSRGLGAEMGAGAKSGAKIFKATLAANLGAKAIGGALSGVKSAVSGAFSGGWNRLMNIEAAKSKFKVLKMDADKTMDSVSTAVDGTRFAISDAADMASVLGATGMKAGKDMERWLKITGDAAQFSNREFSDMQLSIQKVAQQGKVTGDTFNELPVATAALASHLGKSQEEVRKLASAGKISSADFLAAMEKQIGGMASGGGTTVASMLANIKTAWNATMANLMEGVTSRLNPVLEKLLDRFKGIRDAAKPAGEVIGKAFAASIEAVTKLGGSLGSLLKGPMGEIAGGIRAFAASWVAFDGDITSAGFPGWMEEVAFKLRGAWEGVKGAVSGFIEGFGGVDTILATFKDALPLVLGPLGTLKTALMDAFSNISIDASGMKEFGTQIGATLKPLLGAVSQVAAGVSGALGQAFAQLVPVVVKLGGAVGPLVGQLAQKLAPVISQLIQGLMPPLQRGLAAIGDVIGRVVDALTPLIQGIADRLAPLFMNVAQRAAPMLQKAFETIASVVELLGPILGELARIVSEKVGAAFQFLAPVVELVFNSISTTVSVSLDIIRGIIDTATALMKGDWSGVWNAMKGTVTGIWETMKGSVSSAIETIRATISGVTGIIKQNWDSFWGGMKTAGQNAWNWISSTATSVFNKMVAPIRGSFNSIKQAAGTIWGGIKSVITKTVGDLKGGVEGAFTTMRDNIGRIWDGVKNAVKAPIEFVVNTVINGGLIGAFNSLVKKIGLGDLEIDPVTLPAGFADGGWTGPGSKYQPAGIVHADEHVWTKEEMRKFPGGHKRMEQMRAAVRRGERDFGMAGYASGGRVRAPFSGGSWNGGRYRSGKYHGGVDFPRPIGTAVRAAEDGTVISARRMATSYGIHAIIRGVWDMIYAHMSRMIVSQGQQVKQGQTIGAVGSTGNSTGPHLHWEVRPRGGRYGSAVNPLAVASGALAGGGGVVAEESPLDKLKGMLSGAAKKIFDVGKAAVGYVTEFLKDPMGHITAMFNKVLKPSGGAGIIGQIVDAIPGKVVDALKQYAKDIIGFAGGTTSAPPGLAWVGERGPELVQFRGGERVWSNSESVRMASQPSQTQVRIELVDERIRGLIRAEVRQMKREGLVAA